MFEDSINNLDETELRDRAQKLLANYKKAERKTKFYSERINKNTVVFCKNKENIEKYREQSKINSSKLVFKNSEL